MLHLMARVYNGAGRILRREDGQGLVEYGLIIALVAIALVAGLTFLAGKLYTANDCTSVFFRISDKLSGGGVCP